MAVLGGLAVRISQALAVRRGSGGLRGGGPHLGYPQTYVAQPQVSFPPRVDRVSISCGIAGWVVIVLALLDHGAPQVLRVLLG